MQKRNQITAYVAALVVGLSLSTAAPALERKDDLFGPGWKQGAKAAQVEKIESSDRVIAQFDMRDNHKAPCAPRLAKKRGDWVACYPARQRNITVSRPFPRMWCETQFRPPCL